MHRMQEIPYGRKLRAPIELVEAQRNDSPHNLCSGEL